MRASKRQQLNNKKAQTKACTITLVLTTKISSREIELILAY